MRHDSHSLPSPTNSLPRSVCHHRLLVPTKRVPLILDRLALAHHVRVPKCGDHQKSESDVRHSQSHEQTQRSHTTEVLIVASLSILARSGRRPVVQVLQHVTERIRTHQQRGHYHQYERTPLRPPVRNRHLSAMLINVDAQTQHHHKCHAKGEIMAHRTRTSGHRSTDDCNHEGRPTSSTNQSRNTQHQ